MFLQKPGQSKAWRGIPDPWEDQHIKLCLLKKAKKQTKTKQQQQKSK